MCLMPKIPRIGRCSRGEINTFLGLIELLLVLPLLIVDPSWRTATPVKRDIETATGFRFVPINDVVKFQSFVTQLNGLLLHFLRTRFTQHLQVVLPE